MKDRSNDPSHNEWTLLPRSYILLPQVVHITAFITPEEILNGSTMRDRSKDPLDHEWMLYPSATFFIKLLWPIEDGNGTMSNQYTVSMTSIPNTKPLLFKK